MRVEARARHAGGPRDVADARPLEAHAAELAQRGRVEALAGRGALARARGDAHEGRRRTGSPVERGRASATRAHALTPRRPSASRPGCSSGSRAAASPVPPARSPGRGAISSSNITCASRRASEAPRHRCSPKPNATCLRASRTRDVEDVGVGAEDGLVAVCRGVEERDVLAGRELLAAQLGVLLHAAHEILHRGDEAQHLFDGVGHERGIRAQLLPTVRAARSARACRPRSGCAWSRCPPPAASGRRSRARGRRAPGRRPRRARAARARPRADCDGSRRPSRRSRRTARRRWPASPAWGRRCPASIMASDQRRKFA